MKKILMILTKDRRDCVDISLTLHERGGSFEVFDHVVFLLNDVTKAHMRYIDEWIDRHPGVACDKIIGDGTRPQGISDMQNRCIATYPGCFYAKTDEDVFPPPNWARMMWEAYESHRHLDNLALITPLLPNNSYGLYILLNHFYPEYLTDFRERFGKNPEPQRVSPTWNSPYIAEWATRKFIHLTDANEEQRRRLETRDLRLETLAERQKTRDNVNDLESQSTASDLMPQVSSLKSQVPGLRSQVSSLRSPFHPFSIPFSIGCIGYDYRHVERMGGIPWNDEPGWCDWIEQHKQVNILDCRQIALHYTFFVQQEWLDRTTLIEAIRAANLPDTLSIAERLQLPRWGRMLRQLPAIARRRISRKA